MTGKLDIVPGFAALAGLVLVLNVLPNAQAPSPQPASAATGARRPDAARVVRPTLPNPYRLLPDWPTLPQPYKGPRGRKWGEVIRVHMAPNGNLWVFHRCFHDQPNGDATCLNRGEDYPPILEFDPAGTLLRGIGVGLFAHPHGFTVDAQGNLWATDTNDEEQILGMPARDPQGMPLGQTVMKISPEGRVLMTLGRAGVGGPGTDTFDRPTGVAIAADGSIFVSDGHQRNRSNNARVMKFSRDGTFIKTWGRAGDGPGDFREPHDIAIGGSRGYVYVADRLNNRVQVFDQEGAFVAAWRQFGQPSSVYVDGDDNLYVGATYQDPSRGSVMAASDAPNDRAIVVGNALTGELKHLIPDPGDLRSMTDTGTSASGIAVDRQGNIYAADVGFNNLRKYAKVQPNVGDRRVIP